MNRLEMTLAVLPDSIDWPEPSEQLASRVRAHIESGETARSRTRRWAIASALALLVLVMGLLPGTRQALADLFHEAGVRIGFISETPTDLAADVDLGSPVTMEAAAEQVGFELRSPDILGLPDAVYVDDGAVSMVWAGPVLLTQRSGSEPFARKGIGPGTSATAASISGQPGLWIEGAGHTFTLLDEEGNPVQETTRLAANALLWSSGNIDYRLELTDDLDRALEIATSLERSD